MITEKLIEILHINKIIEVEDKELYIFGLNQLAVIVLNIMTTVVIGAVMGMVWESMIFLSMYIPLRSYAGGYHARNQVRCYFFSIVLITTSLIMMKIITWNSSTCSIMNTITSSIIIIFSPIEDINKPLIEAERVFYRKRTIIILIFLTIIYLLFLMLKNKNVVVCVTMTLFVSSFMLILGSVVKKFRNYKMIK